MSLIPSTTAGSATSSYFLQNVGSDAAPTVPTSSAGVVLIDSVAGAASVRSDGTSLSLGGTPSTAPLSITAANTTVSNSLVCNGAVDFNAGVDMSQTAPLLRTFTEIGVVANDGANTALPQPVGLPVGLYSIAIQCNTRPVAALSTISYWNGTGWTIGGSTYSVAVDGGPAGTYRLNPGATLTYYQNSGDNVTLNYIYYTQIGSQFV